MFGYDLKSELVDLKTANNTPELARELFIKSKENINDESERRVYSYSKTNCRSNG